MFGRPSNPDPIGETPVPWATHDTDDADAQAIVWHVRLRGAGDVAPAGFAEWLGADPRHAASFASFRGGVALQGNAAQESGSRRLHYARWGAGGVVATAIAALLTLGPMRQAEPYEVATSPGTRRVISLDEGTQVTLNGGTRIRLDRHDRRVAMLIAGEALFDVRHDAAHPFRLSVSGRQIEDVGTIFNVVADREEVRVTVAEGSVVYNPAGERIALNAGQGLVDPNAGHAIRLVDAPPATIGGWRHGQLVYAGQPLAQVASDLSRALGAHITVLSAVAARPFSGAITLHDGGGEQRIETELARLAPALDLRLERASDGWILKPGNSATR